ncbi:MAG: hypothetical protein QM778_08285 [Myxococcales bacterium]
MSLRTALIVSLSLWSLALAACGPDGAPNARKVIRETHAAEVKGLVVDDIQDHLVGVKAAGVRIAPGFAVEDPKLRETQMRTALRLLTKPPRGIPQLVASARTFTAAVDANGVVLATDAKGERDRMTGVNLGQVFELVRKALAGSTGYAVDTFPAIEEGGEGSVSLLFAAPSIKDDKVVGAVLTGIPLWRLSQRLTKQLQLDHVSEKGAILWVYVYQADKLHHFGTPPDLDTMVPDGAARKSGLAKSPGGYTGDFMQFGRWYAFGVLPVKVLGPDLGVVIFRSDPV